MSQRLPQDSDDDHPSSKQSGREESGKGEEMFVEMEPTGSAKGSEPSSAPNSNKFSVLNTSKPFSNESNREEKSRNETMLTEMVMERSSGKGSEQSSPQKSAGKLSTKSTSRLFDMEQDAAEAARNDPLGMARKSFFFSDGKKKKIKFKRAKKLHRKSSLEYFNMTKDLQGSRFSVSLMLDILTGVF